MNTPINCPIVRALIDPHCPESTFQKHMGDDFFLVRALVALGTQDRVKLTTLSKDRDLSVVSAVAGNPCTFPEVANRLADHEDEVVRTGAAIHPGLSSATHAKLLKDESRMVSDAAKRNSALMAK